MAGLGIHVVVLLAFGWISYTEGLDASYSTNSNSLPIIIDLLCDVTETLMIHEVEYDIEDCECWLDTDLIFTQCNDRSNCTVRLVKDVTCDPLSISECERTVSTLNVEYSCISTSVSLCSAISNNYFGRSYTIIRLLKGDMTTYEKCVCSITGKHVITFLSHKSLSFEESLLFEISGEEQELTPKDMQMSQGSVGTTITLLRDSDDFDSKAVMNLHISSNLRDLLSINCEITSYPPKPVTDPTTTPSTPINKNPDDTNTTTTTTTPAINTTATDSVTVTSINDNGVSSGQSSGNRISTGVIVGAVIGSLVIIWAIIAVIILLILKKRNTYPADKNIPDNWINDEKNPVYIDCPSLIPPGALDCEKTTSKDNQQFTENEDDLYHVYAEIDKSKKIKNSKVKYTEKDNDSSDDDFVNMKSIPQAGTLKNEEPETTEAEYSYAEVPNRLHQFSDSGSTEGSVKENTDDAAPSSVKSRSYSTSDYTTFSDNLAYVGSDDETESKVEITPQKSAEVEDEEENEEKLYNDYTYIKDNSVYEELEAEPKEEEKTEAAISDNKQLEAESDYTQKSAEVEDEEENEEKLYNDYTYIKDNSVYEELEAEPNEEEKTEAAISDNKQPEAESDYTLMSENSVYEC